MRSTRVPRTCLTLFTSLLLAVTFAQSALADKVIAFGEVNGDYETLTELLKASGVVGDDLAWSGGSTHLVSLGNIVGDGAGSSQALDLMMRLGEEAAAAGGSVRVVLGMNEIAVIAVGAGAHHDYLTSQPAMIKIDDTVYVHAGLSTATAELGADQVNQKLSVELGQIAASLSAPDDDALAAKLEEMEVLGANGPLRYRGTGECYQMIEAAKVKKALAALGAKRVVVSHKAYPDYKVISRVDGRVLVANTGMGSSAEGARASAVIADGGQISVMYVGENQMAQPTPEPRRVGPRPGNLTDDDLEEILSNGEVIDIVPVGSGVTEPDRLTLTMDGIQIQAILHKEDTKPKNKREINLSDRYQYNVAAYKVDRMLNLDMMPVTVLRDVNGKEGSVMFWVDGMISETQRKKQEVSGSSWCSRGDQYRLMDAFDILTFNEDRTYENIQYEKSLMLVRLIDMSRTFRINNARPPFYKKTKLAFAAEFADVLRSLDQEEVRAAIGYLMADKNQVRSLMKRRDNMLKDWEKTQK